MQEKQDTNSALIVTGYVTPVLALLILPIVFTPAGVVVGILNISKKESFHGVLHIVLAVAAGLAGASIGGAGFGISLH